MGRDKARTTTDCDGKYRGERHFRCTPGHGLYIPLEDAEFVGVADADVDRADVWELPRTCDSCGNYILPGRARWACARWA